MKVKKVENALYILVTSLVLIRGQVAPKKPNIVIIVADDLGWDDVGFHGSFQASTPNLNYMAYEGQVLMNYYVLPVGSPTRSALLTGKYPIRTGMQTSTIMASNAWGLGTEEKLMPQLLKEQGYKTHLVGKWHLGFFDEKYIPERRGFDSFFGMYAGHGDYWDHTCKEGKFNGLDLRDGKEPVRSGSGNYSTGLLSDVATQLISYHDDSQPLFLMLSYLAIHSGNSDNPLEAEQDVLQNFDTTLNKDRRSVLAMTKALDNGIGKVYDALKRKGILDNTIILFTTDNGAASNGFDSNYGSNFPLRGMKTTLFEGGVRATGFVHSKLLKKTKAHHHSLIHVTDWLPTFYKLAGGNVTVLGDIDGMDVWDSISDGRISQRKEILLNIDSDVYKNEAIIIGNWKYIKQADDELDQWFIPSGYTHDQYASRHRRSNFTGGKVQCSAPPQDFIGCDNGCLFNLFADPCEYSNVALSNPDKLKELVQRLDFYRKQMKPSRYNRTVDPLSDPKRFNDVWSPWMKDGVPIQVSSVKDEQTGAARPKSIKDGATQAHLLKPTKHNDEEEEEIERPSLRHHHHKHERTRLKNGKRHHRHHHHHHHHRKEDRQEHATDRIMEYTEEPMDQDEDGNDES